MCTLNSKYIGHELCRCGNGDVYYCPHTHFYNNNNMYIQYTAEYFLWPITHCRVYSLGLKHCIGKNTVSCAHTRNTRTAYGERGETIKPYTINLSTGSYEILLMRVYWRKNILYSGQTGFFSLLLCARTPSFCTHFQRLSIKKLKDTFLLLCVLREI